MDVGAAYLHPALQKASYVKIVGKKGISGSAVQPTVSQEEIKVIDLACREIRRGLTVHTVAIDPSLDVVTTLIDRFRVTGVLSGTKIIVQMVRPESPLDVEMMLEL